MSLPEAYISEDEGGEAGGSGASGKASVPTEINTGQLFKLAAGNRQSPSMHANIAST